jgi:hypothetical protein
VKQAADGGLVTEIGLRGALAEQMREEPKTYRMTGYNSSTLITSEPESGTHWRLAFSKTDADGRATSVFDGSQVALRV